MAWAVAVTKQDGQSAHDYFYTPFGGIIDDNGHPEDSSNWTDPHNHYLLTGKEWDEESRLYYFGARYYDAATGVWLTQDVYRGQVEQPLTLHHTLYVLANPVNHVDAYGYMLVEPDGYSDSGGGSTPISPQQPVPDNSSQQDKSSPYELKIERDEQAESKPQDQIGSLSLLIQPVGPSTSVINIDTQNNPLQYTDPREHREIGLAPKKRTQGKGV